MENARLVDSPDVLTIVEASKLLRLGRNLTYSLVREGRLRTVRVGRRLLVPRAAVEALLEGAAVTNRPWPREIGQAALIGLPGAFIRTVLPLTEADPNALLVQFMVAAGN